MAGLEVAELVGVGALEHQVVQVPRLAHGLLGARSDALPHARRGREDGGLQRLAVADQQPGVPAKALHQQPPLPLPWLPLPSGSAFLSDVLPVPSPPPSSTYYVLDEGD